VPGPGEPDIDLEVDFDNVRLDATAIAVVSEPATGVMLAGLLAPVVLRGRRRSTRDG